MPKRRMKKSPDDNLGFGFSPILSHEGVPTAQRRQLFHFTRNYSMTLRCACLTLAWMRPL
ncbi:hypothetical protein PAXRUDRAFT_835764, partial [Paxillus rubicundulus Ve08.2h10]